MTAGGPSTDRSLLDEIAAGGADFGQIASTVSNV
jgi:hypothetical protein